jgi:hypothetical protein
MQPPPAWTLHNNRLATARAALSMESAAATLGARQQITGRGAHSHPCHNSVQSCTSTAPGPYLPASWHNLPPAC